MCFCVVDGRCSSRRHVPRVRRLHQSRSGTFILAATSDNLKMLNMGSDRQLSSQVKHSTPEVLLSINAAMKGRRQTLKTEKLDNQSRQRGSSGDRERRLGSERFTDLTFYPSRP